MNRDLRNLSSDLKEQELVSNLRYSTNTTTIQLTLIAAFEAIIPNVKTRSSINFHVIGAAATEFESIPIFEELPHPPPSLIALQLVFVGPNVIEDPIKWWNPYTLQCCAVCTEMGRTISIRGWKGLYHAYIDTQFYKTPDLAAAFHSGFSVDEQDKWSPTIEYLAHAPHPTLFTAARYFEIHGEMRIWKKLEAEFVKNAEVNKWKGMSPSLTNFGDKPNEVTFPNYWWYIVKQR